MGFYRPTDFNDPRVFAAGLAAVLSDYPPDVVKLVTDPRTGIPGKLKWAPTIAEVKSACDEAMKPRQEAARREHLADVARGLRLAAPPLDADALGRIADRAARVSAELGGKPKQGVATSAVEREAAEARLAELQDSLEPLPGLSAEALARFAGRAALDNRGEG